MYVSPGATGILLFCVLYATVGITFELFYAKYIYNTNTTNIFTVCHNLSVMCLYLYSK